MVALIGLVLSIVISLCWYLPGIRAQGKNQVLTGKDYVKVVLLYGLCCTCIPIIITEILWDVVADVIGLSGLKRDLLSDFFRAALLEEFFKLMGFLLAKRSLKLTRKIDYIMIAGLIGLVYGVVEKAMIGNIMGVIVALAIPMHIMWQFNQGGHTFEYEKAKAVGNPALAKREWLMATAVPFLFHGCWDAGLDLVAHFMESDTEMLPILGFSLLLAMIILGAIYTVRTIRKVCATARAESSREAVPEA
ncbi:MAG: hypothetical protein IJ088_16870 [Clostridia bacterium]|nr:hypothetical protein [Clostridia bacterium]